MSQKKVAIMQPYLFPYLGYFQFIQAVDIFVFYDDVNFIKKGWINRNNILINKNKKLFSVPLLEISQHKTINETKIAYEHKDFKKILKSISLAYAKAPFYKEVMPVIEVVFERHYNSIAEMAEASVKQVASYLKLDRTFCNSSRDFPETKGLEKADRLIAISKKIGVVNYVNAPGGKILYEKPYFKESGVELLFIENQLSTYKQFDNEFVSGLSIIDVLMFNGKDTIKQQLQNYKLV